MLRSDNGNNMGHLMYRCKENYSIAIAEGSAKPNMMFTVSENSKHKFITIAFSVKTLVSVSIYIKNPTIYRPQQNTKLTPSSISE